MKIKVIIENLTKNPNMKSEHGLSIYIEVYDRKYIFDFGKSSKFIENAKSLGINMEDIDCGVLSHGHYDHSGGLQNFMDSNKKAKVYMKPEYMNNHYCVTEDKQSYIGINKEILPLYIHRIVEVEGKTQIEENIYVIEAKGNKICSLGKDFRLKKLIGQEFLEDDFQDEIMLIIEENQELTVFTGCSHNGIVNMVNKVTEEFPNKGIKRAIGGFHLIGNKDMENVDNLAKELLNCPVEKFYTCHCTDYKNYEILKNIMGSRIEYISTGDIIE